MQGRRNPGRANRDGFLRPECVTIHAGEAPQRNLLVGTVAEFTFLGQMIDCTLVLRNGIRIKIRMPPKQVLNPGQQLTVCIDEEDCSVMS